VALLAVASPWLVGAGLAFHHVTDDHHAAEPPTSRGALDLATVLHGHAHAEGTPEHGHPFAGSVAAPLPGKQLLLIGAMIGDVPEIVGGETPRRPLLSRAGPTRDPPPRFEAVPVLRI
jgi:hypothetical protein